jgi:tetratricopeptide (TPR) repeat protein
LGVADAESLCFRSDSMKFFSTSRRRSTGVPSLARRIVLSVAAIVSAEVGLDTCRADTVQIGTGVQVDGQILRETNSESRPALIVELDDDLKIAIPSSRVTKTIRDSELENYRKYAEAAGNDAEAHYQLGRICRGNGLMAQRDFHFQRAIELDPDHSQARAALGYVRNGNEWVKFTDQQRMRGMVPAASGWMLFEEYRQEQAQEEYEVAAKQWIREFTRLQTTVLRNNKRSPEALEEIKAIDDPTASQAVADAFESSRGNDRVPVSLRRLYIKKLAEFKTPVAVRALVEAGFQEPDRDLRAFALEKLQEYGAASAVATYLPVLSNPAHTPEQVTAALEALQYFPDPELWRTYVDALVTTHKKKLPKGAGMSVGTSSIGGGGLSVGGKEKVIVSKQTNPAARKLLTEIAPDVDFGYDQQAWLEYFADKLIGSPGDLRRDP